MNSQSLSIETRDGRRRFAIDPLCLVSSGVCDRENAWAVAHFLLAYTAYLSDSPLKDTAGLKPARAYNSWWRRITTSSVKDLVNGFSSLADRLLSSCYLSGELPITGEFLPEMSLTPIYKEYISWYKGGDPELLRYILGFLRFGKKLPYVDEEFYTTAFREWLEVEESIPHELQTGLVDALRSVVSYLLPPDPKLSYYPKFGPGAVAETGVRGNIQKSNRLLYDPLIHDVFYRKAEDAVPFSRVIPDPWAWDSKREWSSRVSELRFVPKDLRKSRSICMEPNTIMFHQQMVHDMLRDAIRRGPIGRHVRLEDQGGNQQAALHGSEFGSVDTIDLSSASDSVPYVLVRQIFSDEYLRYLDATRTDIVKCPDGSVRVVRKFAPMGSAVCFPIQCIVFSAVVYLAHYMTVTGRSIEELGAIEHEELRRLGRKFHRAYNPDTPYTHRFEHFLVYGDDIVCDSRVTPLVTLLLTSLGFRVNTSKSFTGSQAVRESCGIYAWQGYDVTPFHYKVPHHSHRLSGDVLESVIQNANLSGDRGYHNLQRFFVQLALHGDIGRRKFGGKNSIPFTTDHDAYGIFVKVVRNDHLKRRYNEALQRDELCVTKCTVREWREPHSFQLPAVEAYLYVQWWRARRRCDDPVDLAFAAQRRRPEEIGLSRKWIPA